MIAGLLTFLAVAATTFPVPEDRWIVLPGDATATVSLDRLSIRQNRQQKLWVRAKWSEVRDGVAYSDWLENFDCSTLSSFPSRIINYAADGTILGELEGNEDFMSIIGESSRTIVRDMACGTSRSSATRNDR